MMLCGIGFGFFQAPNNRALIGSAPLDRSGAAAGMLATSRVTGQTIGATITAILFALAARGEVASLATASAFAIAALCISLTRISRK